MFVKPTPPPADVLASEPDPFTALLPANVTRALESHRDASRVLIHELGAVAASHASGVSRTLASLDLPEALDAVNTDKRLPPRLLQTLETARRLGGVDALTEMLASARGLETDIDEAASMARALLDAEETRDAEVIGANDGLTLDGLRTTAQLAELRARVAANVEHYDKAVTTTASLRSRLDAARAEIGKVQAPVSELEARMPHLDGTPLEAEPCVPALRDLLEQLYALKVEDALAVSSARAIQDDASAGAREAELAARLLETGDTGVLAAELGPIEALKAEMGERHERRRALLDKVGRVPLRISAPRRDGRARTPAPAPRR